MYSRMDRFKIFRKWLLSFLKSSWEFEDYPVDVRPNGTERPVTGWIAQFMYWPGPVVLGATPEEAMAELKSAFEEERALRREAGERMPRPGTFEPIKFAPDDVVRANPELLDHFTDHVLGFVPGSAVFISDQSSLYDFGEEEDVLRYRGLIRSNYGVETSDIEDASIAEILCRIEGSSWSVGG